MDVGAEQDAMQEVHRNDSRNSNLATLQAEKLNCHLPVVVFRQQLVEDGLSFAELDASDFFFDVPDSCVPSDELLSVGEGKKFLVLPPAFHPLDALGRGRLAIETRRREIPEVVAGAFGFLDVDDGF